MTEQEPVRVYRLKVATVWILVIAGAIGAVLQFWWWHTGHLEPLQIFWPAPAALVASFLLDMRWNLTVGGDENAH